MARQSPLLGQHQQAEALLETYGPPEAGVQVVQTFGDPDLEYAAIRKGCGLIDLPHRATLEITGKDRLDFLGRMITQETKGFQPWSARRSFWLSRKGRIDADLRLINLPDRLMVDLDVHAAGRAVEGLSSFIFSEDCAITDQTEQFHRLALHGPSASALLAKVSTVQNGDAIDTIAAGRAAMVTIAGTDVIVDRDDSTGQIGLEVLAPAGAIRAIWDELLETGCRNLESSGGLTSAPYHMRPIGWAAYNVARIEAGTPLYFLDFGPDSLPHETSLLDSRVSFTKGCYLGQEIVARMQSLGAPKKKLVALTLRTPRLSTGSDPTSDADLPEIIQPVTGAAVFAPPATPGSQEPRPSDCGEPVGAITSSCISPMLGSTPLCFAMVKTALAAAGTKVLVDCDGALVAGTVQAGLRTLR